MKILTYIFWKTTRRRLQKDGFDVTYFSAVILFGLLIITIPFTIIQSKTPVFEYFFSSSKLMQNVFYIVLLLISGIPFWIIFPKEKIRNLNYSDEKKKDYNRKILYGILFFILLLIFRIIYVKFYKH